MSTKLQWINSELANYDLLLSSYLSQQDVSRSLVQNYLKHGWLESVAAGVYKKPKKQLSWSSALSAAQFQLNLPLHLTGVSSLAQQGISHYLPLSQEKIQVSFPSNRHIPKWLTSAHWNLTFNTSKILKQIEKQDLVDLVVNNQKIRASCIEFAALEAMDNVHDEPSFVFVAELFQGFTSLRPKRVQSLLQRSTSVRVKRLFLFLSHYYKHPWLSRLDENSIDLGSGKRQIIKKGALNKAYQITVPKKFQPMDTDSG